MSQQTIGVGTSANDGTGDPLRTAFQKTNANFTELYGTLTIDRAVADGGTGASDAPGARTNLGLVIGTNVQAYDAQLADIAGISFSQGDILYHDGSNIVRLAAGTSGHFLKTNGAGANPAWAAPAGASLADGDYGDVTVSSSGTVITIDNSAVTLAKIANAAANSKLLGSGASGSGSAYAEITLGSGLSMTGTTLSATGVGLTDGDKGDVTVSSSGATWTIDNDVVTYAKMQDVSAASKLLGRGDSGSGDVQEITLGSGLSMSGTTLSASGGGSGKPFLLFRPIDNEPPTSNFATLDTRNNRPVLDFDDTTQEAAIFTGVLASAYASGGLTIDVYVAMTSATSGTVGFDVAIERTDASSLDIDADSFATAQTITATTVPGTSGQILKLSVNISDGANMDSLAAGELFRLRLRRDVANDTATGDAEVLAVTMREQ